MEIGAYSKESRLISTRMTRIKRIFTDFKINNKSGICVNPLHPLNPCSNAMY